MYTRNKQINILFIILPFVIVFITSILGSSDNPNPSDPDEFVKLMNYKTYSNMFVRRREEIKIVFKRLLKMDNYETRYKMLEIALTNILEVIKNSKNILVESKFIPGETKFPKNLTLFEAFTSVLENTSLFGDLLLHMPDETYKILRHSTFWKELINWSLDFTLNSQKYEIIDETTMKMLDLFDQEIHPEKRTADFINPYTTKEKPTTQVNKQKKKKIIKRGPHLIPSRNEL